MSCTHHWIRGGHYTVKAVTVRRPGTTPRIEYDVLDSDGEHVDTYHWEHEAVEACERLKRDVCCECGERREVSP